MRGRFGVRSVPGSYSESADVVNALSAYDAAIHEPTGAVTSMTAARWLHRPTDGQEQDQDPERCRTE